MKVKYIGHGSKITIRIPIDLPKRKQTHMITFDGQEIKEFPEEEALKLVERTPRMFEIVDAAPKEDPVKEEEPKEEKPKKKRGRPKKEVEKAE